MQNEELRELTASEPLSLEEEYDMQQKWQIDEDKLTFIILARQGSQPSSTDPTAGGSEGGGEEAAINGEDRDLLTPHNPNLALMPMIGDVNLFLKGTRRSMKNRHVVDDHYEGGGTSVDDHHKNHENDTHDDINGVDGEDDFEAEVEIMIAELEYRRKGLALEALQLMLGFATGSPNGWFPHPPSSPSHRTQASPSSPSPHSVQRSSSPTPPPSQSPLYISPLPVPPTSLVTRISESNIPSIRLFEKLGFVVTKRVEVFGEVEMRYRHR